MHQNLHSRRNLSADDRNRKFHAAHHYHGNKSLDHIRGTVGMGGPQAPLMSGIQAHKKIRRLRTSHFSHDNSVRPHTQRRPDQIPDRDLPALLHGRIPGLQTNQVGNPPELKLRVILDGDNPLSLRNAPGECIQKRGLSGGCPPADQNRISGLHKVSQKFRRLPGDAARLHKPSHGNRIIRKPSDGKNSPVQRNRGKHHIDAGSVFQSGIRNRLLFIDNPVAGACNLLDHILIPLTGGKAFIPETNDTVPFIKNIPVTVYHDFRDRRIIHQLLQNIQLSHGIQKILPDLLLLRKRKKRIFLPDQPIHGLLNFFFRIAVFFPQLLSQHLPEPFFRPGRTFRFLPLLFRIPGLFFLTVPLHAPSPLPNDNRLPASP